MDKILVDMIERPEFVEALLDRILYEWNLPIIDQQLAIGVDGFYFAEDWGSETLAPVQPAAVAAVHQAAHGAHVRSGPGGRRGGRASTRTAPVGRLFPDLIEIGMQVFNPLSPTIMEPAEYEGEVRRQDLLSTAAST